MRQRMKQTQALLAALLLAPLAVAHAESGQLRECFPGEEVELARFAEADILTPQLTGSKSKMFIRRPFAPKWS